MKSEDFPRVNEALDSVLTFQLPFPMEEFQVRLSRFRFYDREFWPTLQEHDHPFFEWVVTMRGKVNYSVGQKKLGMLQEGSGLLFAPSIQHLRPRLEGDVQLAILHFSLDPVSSKGSRILERVLRSLAEKQYCLSHLWSAGLEEIIHYAALQPPLWRIQIRNRTEKLLLSLLEQEFGDCFALDEENSAQDSAQKWIERIEKLVENTLDARLASAEYAQKLGLSMRQINRIVSQKRGVTFFRYLQQRRINAAQILLRAPFESVKMVANTVGFSDISLFCRQFRRETGMTPLEYAKSHSGDTALKQ